MRNSRAWRIPLAALAILVAAPLPAERATPIGTGADWSGHGGSADESGYSTLAQINRGTVGKLGLAWSLDLPGESQLQATPLAVGGTLYFTGSMSKVYAVDARTGKLLWTHDPEIWKLQEKMRLFFPVNRGPAYDNGRIFATTLDGRLQALDATTGKLVWSVETLTPGAMQMVTGAPRTFRGKVIIGNGGADFNARGYVTAYDQANGKQVWRFYTVPGSPDQNKGDPAMEAAARTWSPDFWKKTGGGGTVWNGITFDPELNRIYLGTGNSGPYNPELRSPGGGDNLYLASIVALDADTGKYLWHYQQNPREAWDYKSTQNIILATLAIGGKNRKVLMQAPTNGFFYVLDRETGTLISAEKTGKVTWAERIDLKTGRPVEAPNIRYETGETTIWPSSLGTHNWHDMAFSPKARLVYIPYMQLGARFTSKAGDNQILFSGVVVTGLVADDQDGKGALLAWDPVAQKARWRVPHPYMWNGGPLATAGDLVFQGIADGWLTAYDAASGKRLWGFDAGLGIIARPITYSVAGKQYVSVLVGWGSNPYAPAVLDAGWKYGAQPRRLLTFAIGGTQRLPASAPPDRKLHPIDDAAYQVIETDLPAGYTLFAMKCAMCHGTEAISGNVVAPDLRESPIGLDGEAFWTVLHDGPLVQRGMPRFDELTRADSDKLRNYLRAAAREAMGTRKPMKYPAMNFGGS